MSFPERSFDDWKERYPDVPSATVPTGFEHCEICGHLVRATSVARCGSHFSYYPSRPERRGGK